VREDQLAFLENQTKPLLLPDVTKRLGDTEIGNGPFYPYKISGTARTIRFWLAQPPGVIRGDSVPAEVAMVTDQRGDAPDVIIWPQDLKGSNVQTALKTLYPKNF
jgi:hypothetical protein